MKIEIFGLIFALLLVFKIAGIAGMATVSWWVVFLPVLIPLCFWVMVVVVFVGGWNYLTKR